MVSSTPRLHFTPGKDPVPILQEVGWAPEPVWTGGKSRPHWDSIPDRPDRRGMIVINNICRKIIITFGIFLLLLRSEAFVFPFSN